MQIHASVQSSGDGRHVVVGADGRTAPVAIAARGGVAADVGARERPGSRRLWRSQRATTMLARLRRARPRFPARVPLSPPRMPPATDLRPLVNPKERRYYALLVVLSLGLYGLLGLGALGGLAAAPDAFAGMLVYVVGFPVTFFVLHGLGVGYLRGNGVRASERQFPELLQMAQRHAATLGLDRVPDLFVLQSGGMLNAFATRFLGRDFVVVYSDVLAMAESRGESAVSFIVAHELAHVKRGHLKHRWLTLPGRVVPFLGSAYSRACEYTCDRFGAHCEPAGAVDGLLVLAAGRELYHRVAVRDFARQVETDGGFWVRWAELISTHPRLPKRVAALLAAGVSLPSSPAPAYSPMGSGATVGATAAWVAG